ncbi:MAG: hypothetical protein ACMX3H_03780 [Sodalis sp. (in: enterobacteria)]|uniref:hypothetical protein n=1 Tax=Sodalis sp. (in: enterobacteria) TaxID=1898979 RepID=UPI0039E450D4
MRHFPRLPTVKHQGGEGRRQQGDNGQRISLVEQVFLARLPVGEEIVGRAKGLGQTFAAV